MLLKKNPLIFFLNGGVNFCPKADAKIYTRIPSIQGFFEEIFNRLICRGEAGEMVEEVEMPGQVEGVETG